MKIEEIQLYDIKYMFIEYSIDKEKIKTNLFKELINELLETTKFRKAIYGKNLNDHILRLTEKNDIKTVVHFNTDRFTLSINEYQCGETYPILFDIRKVIWFMIEHKIDYCGIMKYINMESA